jgi:hypothetical protein
MSVVTVPAAAPLTAGTSMGEGVRPPGRRQVDDVNLVAAGVSGDQRGEVRQTPYSRRLTAGGEKPGQGYRVVRA